MPMQQHLNKLGLDRPADCSIFARVNGLTRLWASPCWHGNGLARTDSVLALLAYGQHGEQTLVRNG